MPDAPVPDAPSPDALLSPDPTPADRRYQVATLLARILLRIQEPIENRREHPNAVVQGDRELIASETSSLAV